MVCEGARCTYTSVGMVTGRVFRAYTTRTPSASAVVSAGAMPEISAVSTFVMSAAPNRAANAPPTANIKAGST